MDSKVCVYVHHHGYFTPHPNVKYVGGEVDLIEDFDTDLLCFRDLDEFAASYKYDPSDLVYFKNDGRTFKSGLRLLFDDNTVREMVEISRPLGRIDLYVDHYELDEVIDGPQRQTGENEAAENEGGEDEPAENEGGEDKFSDESHPSDPEYDVETETDDSDEDSLYDEFGSQVSF